MSQDLVLQVRDLNVWYRPSGTIGRRKRRQVLHDVSFDLHRGEILGLVGESGSGKTTLARTILGFVPDYTGTVTHFTKRPQMVFQDPASSLNPSRTVGWILAEPLRIYGKYGKEGVGLGVEVGLGLIPLRNSSREGRPSHSSIALPKSPSVSPPIPNISSKKYPVGSMKLMGLLPAYAYRCCVHGAAGSPVQASWLKKRPVLAS